MAGRASTGRGSIWFRLLVALGAIVCAITLFGVLVATKPRPARIDREPPVLTVRTVILAEVEAPRVWVGYGTARAMRVAEISAEVSAQVVARERSIEPGMPIEAGATILSLERGDFEKRVASSEARVAALRSQIDGLDSSERRWVEQSRVIENEIEIVQAELARYLDARARDAANAAEVDARLLVLRRLEREAAAIAQQLDDVPFQRASLRSQLLDQEAALGIAQRELERTQIRSPITGVLQRVDPRPGEYVSAGQSVARVVDLSVIEAPLLAPMSAASDLRVGDKVEAASDSPSSPVWQGRIARISPETDALSRTITLYAEIEQDASGDTTQLLRPGQFLVARTQTGIRSRRLVVPRRAIDGDRVMVATEDAETPGIMRARSREIRTLYHLDASFPALDPLETQWSVVEGEIGPGDIVIVSNLDAISPGTRVRTAQGRDAPDSAARDSTSPDRSTPRAVRGSTRETGGGS
ncbi:MAG: efflux RND transporter periplasmic adaptor subunit [Phycisphaeraceae bacterium]|nr:efflux RND transporter periplasmic adaptor subunit [Phycisphaeraceae bacterium]